MVYYTKNGESWIRLKDEYSVDVKVNLITRVEYGFFRVGFDYFRMYQHKINLNCAYIENEKEMLEFDKFAIDEKKIIIWMK